MSRVAVCFIYVELHFFWFSVHYGRPRILGMRWHDFVRNSQVSLRTGLAPVPDRIIRGRNAIFGHVARLPVNTPAHQAMLCQVKLSVGRPPDPSWKRPPGRPCTKWTEQLHRDNYNVPSLWFCGGKPLVAVTRERLYGLSWLALTKTTVGHFSIVSALYAGCVDSVMVMHSISAADRQWKALPYWTFQASMVDQTCGVSRSDWRRGRRWPVPSQGTTTESVLPAACHLPTSPSPFRVSEHLFLFLAPCR